MNVGAVTLSRFRELVRSRTSFLDMTVVKKGILKGCALMFGWLLFLYAFFQISETFHLEPLVLLAGTSLIYMCLGRVHRFWVAVGLTLGAFLMMLVGLPMVRVLQVVAGYTGRFMTWHLGDGPIFFGWNAVGWITAVVGLSAFLPYGIVSAHRLWQQYKDASWIKKEILPQYEAGKLLCSDDRSLTPLLRDEIAEYWAGLSVEEVEDRAIIVAMRSRCRTQDSLAELQQIHYRAQARLKSPRYQQRHKV